MGKHEKTIQRMCGSPAPSDIRWDDLVSALRNLGFQLLKNSGSRRKFFHPVTSTLIICHQPHPEPNVPKYMIQEVIEKLRADGLI